jgi:peptide/nickel transport system substrate-binding protein
VHLWYFQPSFKSEQQSNNKEEKEMKRYLVLLLAIVMVLSCMACSTGGSSAPAAPAAQSNTGTGTGTTQANTGTTETAASIRDTLIIGADGDLESPDPYGGTSAGIAMMTNTTFNTLIVNEVGGGTTPELATEWKDVNGNGTVWDIKLRDNVTFHNGSKLTADDVIFTWNRITDPTQVKKVFTGTCVTACEKIEAIDPLTVRFTMSQPVPDFISYLEIKIYSKEAFDTMPAEDACAIGTGPYIFNKAETKSGVQYVTDRYDNYWEGIENHPTKKMVYRVLTSADTLVAALQAKEVDITCNVVPAQVGVIQTTDYIKLESVPGEYSYYIGMNYRNNPDFQDHDFRVAISQALDRDAMVLAGLEGYGTPNYCLVTPLALGYAQCNYLPRDVEAAKKYIDANGYAGKSYVVAYPNQKTKGIAEVFQANLSAVGIKIELKAVDSSNWTAFKKGNDYDFFVDAIGFKGALLYNVNRLLYTGGSSNAFDYNNPEYNAAQDAVSAKTTWEDMLAEFKNLQQFIVDDMAVIPILYDDFIYAYREDVHGVVLASSRNYNDYSTVYVTD